VQDSGRATKLVSPVPNVILRCQETIWALRGPLVISCYEYDCFLLFLDELTEEVIVSFEVLCFVFSAAKVHY
jgi:hypothetical protein